MNLVSKRLEARRATEGPKVSVIQERRLNKLKCNLDNSELQWIEDIVVCSACAGWDCNAVKDASLEVLLGKVLHLATVAWGDLFEDLVSSCSERCSVNNGAVLNKMSVSIIVS